MSSKKSKKDNITRPQLTKIARDKATKHQVKEDDQGKPGKYTEWYGRTLDETTNFKKFAASFHKLLEHEQNTGLLTNTGSKNGVQNYETLLQGLKIDSPSSNFDQAALNNVKLAIDAAPGKKRRVIINPQSGKALTIKGGDSEAYSFKYQPVTMHGKYKWEVDYDVLYAHERGDRDKLLEELSFKSTYSAAEMVEVYGMALLRGLKFSEYQKAYNSTSHPWHNQIHAVIDALNVFANDVQFRGPTEDVGGGVYKVTPKTLFRGNSPESIRGDYVSKFFDPLRRPPQFASGCAPGTGTITNAEIFFNDFAQKYLVPPPNLDRAFGVTFEDYVVIQNGDIPDVYHVGDFFKPPVLITTGLILASSVHLDSLYQEYAWAVDVLTGGDYRRTPVSPYTAAPDGSNAYAAKNEGDGPTLGPPDAAGLVGAVALEAARVAWWAKYNVARRARPEVFAALIHKRRNGGNQSTYGPIDNRLLKMDLNDPVRKLLELIKSQNASFTRYNDAISHSTGDPNTYLLSQVFPEASPAHPAWTSGHATVAGACVTVIKAIFDDTAPLLTQKNVPKPPAFTDEEGIVMVSGELDKLASNVALGRNFGGVHFRSDGEHGILLGEEVAIRFLQDHLRTYRELFRDGTAQIGVPPFFELTKRNRQRIRITPDLVETVSSTHRSAAALEPEPRSIADRSIL